MNLIFITDLHEELDGIAGLPEADLLLIGGDFTNFGTEADLRKSVQEVSRLWHAPFFAVGGNLDPASSDAILQETGHAMPPVWQGRRLFGIGGANCGPIQTPYQWDDAARLDELSGAAAMAGKLDILVTHAPPLNFGADVIPNGMHVGSRAIAAFAAECRPVLHCCGHIHEAVGIFKENDSILVNPGAFGKTGGYAWIEWNDGQGPAVVLRSL